MGGACRPDLRGAACRRRVTPGVVRVGDTVRRPVRANSTLVRALLTVLEERGFDGAPRSLGSDADGRETSAYLPGRTPVTIARYRDDQIIAATRLLRRFHDLTVAHPLAQTAETVVHGDAGPNNFVFDTDNVPYAMIDFDGAEPGGRLTDVAYTCLSWCIHPWITTNVDLAEQAAQVKT